MALLLSTISDPKGLGALANKSLLLLLFSENKKYIRIQSHRDRHAKLRSNHIVLEHPETINLFSPHISNMARTKLLYPKNVTVLDATSQVCLKLAIVDLMFFSFSMLYNYTNVDPNSYLYQSCCNLYV